jgi:anti-anti-sigma factor
VRDVLTGSAEWNEAGMDLNIDVRGGGAQPVVMHLCGDIDIANAAAVASAVEIALGRAAESSTKILILDFSETDYCGSVLLRALAELDESAPTRGVALRVVATGAFRRLLEVTGLDEVFNLHGSLQDALPPGMLPSES